MSTKLLLLLLLALLLTAADWRPARPDIIYLPTPSQIQVVCMDGQIPTVVWIHQNVAVIECEG